jgi:hypothetical protein
MTDLLSCFKKNRKTLLTSLQVSGGGPMETKPICFCFLLLLEPFFALFASGLSLSLVSL